MLECGPFRYGERQLCGQGDFLYYSSLPRVVLIAANIILVCWLEEDASFRVVRERQACHHLDVQLFLALAAEVRPLPVLTYLIMSV